MTNLDRAVEAQQKVSKEIQNLLWAQNKYMEDVAFLATCQKKPQKIAASMFEVLTKKHVVDVALKLVGNCAQDTLEEALQSCRYSALDNSQRVYNEKCKEAIILNQKVQHLRKEYGVVAEAAGPNNEDSMEDEDSIEEPVLAINQTMHR